MYICEYQRLLTVYVKLLMDTLRTFHSIGTMTVDPSWRMSAHSHDHDEMLIVVHGTMAVSGEAGVHLQASAGDVLLYPVGAQHAETNSGDSQIEMVFMLFDGDMGETLALVHDNDGRVRTLAGWLLETRGATYPGTPQQALSLACAMAEEFVRLRSRADINPLVESVRAAVYANLARPLNLKGLARRACLSEFHFIRSYKRACGCAPMADARRIRLEEARKMILTTGLPLRAVADATGFANEYHFSQAFRKHFGSPPGAFRR